MPRAQKSSSDNLGIWGSILGSLSLDLVISEILTGSTGAAAADGAIRTNWRCLLCYQHSDQGLDR